MQIMKKTRVLLAVGLVLGFTFPANRSVPAADQASATGKIRVLLVTGGHAFEREPFLAMFNSFTNVTFQYVEHPKAHDLFAPEAASRYDILVLYDMWKTIDDAVRTNFVNLLKRGKGLVVLHHAIANYNDWDQYAGIIGAKYYLKAQTVNGVEKARSQFKHDVVFTVRICDPSHPITRGLKDFEIHDETYNLFDVDPGVKPLLTTEAPTSGKIIGWAKEYGKSRVAYIQLGHDHLAYENPNYRQLVQQAICWAAEKQ